MPQQYFFPDGVPVAVGFTGRYAACSAGNTGNRSEPRGLESVPEPCRGPLRLHGGVVLVDRNSRNDERRCQYSRPDRPCAGTHRNVLGRTI